MPPASIEDNQADFSGRYRPLDAARYNTEQSQAYYERMRAQINERSKSLLSGHQGLHSEGAGTSAYNAGLSGRHEPKRREYRTKGRRDRAEVRDVVTRSMSAPMNFYDAFNEFGTEFGVAEPVDKMSQPVYSAIFGGGSGAASSMFTKAGLKTMGHSMLTGAAAGVAAYGAAEAGIQYSGIREGFNQFEEIRKLRGVSRPMTAGVASGPNGLMSRDMAQNVTTRMGEEARLNNLEREGESLSKLKEQAGILADYQLLEGTRSADEFEKTFKRLKEGVKKVMEVMGTTFEEGTKLMKDFRNAGINPMRGVDLINQGRLTSAQFGNNFKEGHASGMQSAMAMRGTGFSMGAGYQMGQYASGMAQHIYEGNYLDDKTMYNVGGQRGVQQKLQRSNMRFMESPQFTAMMMGAQTQGGQFDQQTIMQTLAGSRGMAENAAAAGQSISSVQDVLNFRANNRDFISKMMENNPGILQGLQVQSVMSGARQMGLNPENMNQGQLAQLAPMVSSMTPNQFKVNAAAVRALPETIGRRKEEERRTAESRAQDMYRTSAIEGIQERIRESPTHEMIVRGSANAMIGSRNNIYEFQQDLTATLTREFTGQRTIEGTGRAASFFSEISDQKSGEKTKGRGIFKDPNDLFSTSDSADILETYVEEGVNSLEESAVTVPSGRRYNNANAVALTEKERKELGLPKPKGLESGLPFRQSPEDRTLANRSGITSGGILNRSAKQAGPLPASEDDTQDQELFTYTHEEIRRNNVAGYQGDPEAQDGKNMLQGVKSGQFGFNLKHSSAPVKQGRGEQTVLFPAKRLNERLKADRNLAKTIDKIGDRQTEEFRTARSLSEKGQRYFNQIFKGSVSRDELMDVRKKSGESANAELSRLFQRTLKENMPSLEGEVGSLKLTKSINQRFKNNKALQDAAALHRTRLESRGLEQQFRLLETGLELPKMNIGDVQEVFSDVQGSLNEVAEKRYKGGLEQITGDPLKENKLTDNTKARDALIMRRFFQTSEKSPEDLSDRMFKRYKRAQQMLVNEVGIKPGSLDKIARSVGKEMNSRGTSISEVVKSFDASEEHGLLSKPGEQESSTRGGKQPYQDSEKSKRQQVQDKLLEVARILKGMEGTVEDMQAAQKRISSEVYGSGTQEMP